MFAFVPKISLFLAGVGIFGGIKSVSSTPDSFTLTETEIKDEKVQNCQFISMSKTPNIPQSFNVTDKDYFSVFCEDETDNILPNSWRGFFPKSFFVINEGIIEGKRIDLRAKDDVELEEDSLHTQTGDEGWLGIKISGPKLVNHSPIRAKLTYYSEDSSWAEIEPISHSDKKIYLLLDIDDATGEESHKKIT